MPLPSLTDWDSTRDGLHQAAQALGAAAKAHAPRQPLALHLALHITPDGLTTGRLPGGTEGRLDYGRRLIHVTLNGAISDEIALDTVRTPFAGLVPRLTRALYPGLYRSAPGDGPIAGDPPPPLNAQIAADYAVTQYALFTALARFRARLLGSLSPLVLWPHNFDVAFLRLTDPELSDDKLHAGFGFEPRSAGFARPYLYAYVRPTPDGITQAALPAPARWFTAGWTGVVIDYDAIAAETNPETAVEALLLDVYAAIKPFLDG